MDDLNALRLTDGEMHSLCTIDGIPYAPVPKDIADAQLEKVVWGIQEWLEELHKEMPTLSWIDGGPVALDAYLRDKLLAAGIPYYKAKGTLEQRPCEHCGDTKSLAHHEDYSKPLVVMWLCQPCHSLRHKLLAAGIPKEE